jgi:hypothetical protein
MNIDDINELKDKLEAAEFTIHNIKSWIDIAELNNTHNVVTQMRRIGKCSKLISDYYERVKQNRLSKNEKSS